MREGQELRPERAASRDDLSLLQATAAGDRAAFGAFVARHLDAVYRYARLLTGDDAEAEDVLQDTFINAMRGAAGFRGEGSARGWLLTIARRALVRSRRLRAGQPTRFEPLDALGAAAGWGDPATPESLAAAAEARGRLEAALASLSPEDREILLLRDVEGLTNPEAATLLGVSLAAVKSRLHRARLRLAAALRAGGADRAAKEEAHA